ncbi:competence-stimulating peptide type 1 domain protein [Streptococcus pneumoniae GA40563]|nr:competence-stimulating peptide type 1 domain protein [Streptococcus pneumoniae GA40563]
MYNGFCKLAYKKNILGDFIMKNTVKLEQFVALKEKDLQKIKGGEMRISRIILDFLFLRKK